MIPKLKKIISTSLKSKKINVFLLFLVLAFMILVLTKLSKNYTNTIPFVINKKNIPEEHKVLNDSNHILDLTIKTNGFRLLKYYFAVPSIDMNFSKNMVKNDSLYVWNRNEGFNSLNMQLDKHVELVDVYPDTLKFKYDNHSVKMVPIRLNSDVKFAPGFDLFEEFELDPDSVRVVGPNILLSAINFVVTDTLRLNDIKSDISEAITLQLPENNKDLIFSNSKVTLIGNVQKFTEGTLKIPLEIINVPNEISIKYFPKQVTVSYYTSLSQFNSITAKDFRVECDYSMISDDQTYLIPEIALKPSTVKNVKIMQQRIEFIITE